MARQNYGVTPWGKWFIEVLTGYKIGSRLDRGRSYANTGKVLSLNIKDGTVTAKVKGNYQPFYLVEITFPPLAEQARVLGIIEEDPALLARISAGELPEELLLKLKQEHINLIPAKWKEMERHCNCPDWGDPCKHLAALYFVLAREIDADPRILFRLRGIDLSGVAERFGAPLTREIPPPFTVEADTAPREPAAVPPEFPAIPHCAELLLSLLPPSPPFCERDFAVVLAEFYHHAARTASMQKIAEADPETEHTASRSRWTIECVDPKPAALPVLAQETVTGGVLRYSVYEGFQQFCCFASDDGTPSYTFLFHLFKFLNLIVRAGAYIPAVYLAQKTLKIVWKPYTLPVIEETLNALASLEAELLPMQKRFAGGRSVVDLLSSAFLSVWVQETAFTVKQKGDAVYRELLGLFFQGTPVDTAPPAMRSLPLSIDRWLSVLSIDFSVWKYRLTLKPVSVKKEVAETPDFKLGAEVLLDTETGIEKIPLKDGVKRTGSIGVLKAPTALAHYLPEFGELTAKLSVRLSEERLVYFLDTAAPLLERLGIDVTFPKTLHRELKPRLVLQTKAKQAGSLVRYLNLDALLEWQWQVAIGDAVLTQDEFTALVQQKRPLVKFRDAFVRLDPAELARLLKQAQSASAPQRNDFLKAYFAGDSLLSFDAEAVIDTLLTERSFPVPETLHAELRGYQLRGYNWICSLLFAGFGCILADDMGLGKTIQAITVLLRLKEEGLLARQCLVVAPAALLENWERELNRFAPSVSAARYHGPGRRLDDAHDVFLTTYQTAVRDEARLREYGFSLLIVDEAHLMKNAETKGAKTVKLLSAQYRLALSGTPVENRLEDMRSLFDFILPGYLGTAAEFKQAYRMPIEVLRDKETAERLRSITAPFLLRRLKTDTQIIADLPEKVSITEYAVLEKGQAALYESIVSETLKKSENMEDPSQRSMLILGLLTSLKQVCDHPRVYDKESPAVSRLSGKAQLLVTQLSAILCAQEKTLIFSQYVETLECLKQIIQNELGEPVLLYHGGISQKRRTAIVDGFQQDRARRILLVSLRAGGLGLNLTAASRVIHYDLWYNPAVEQQATDRAFRIGQTRNVFVHRFITKNTFEEKIDAMLTNKRDLADMTVAAGETWLTKMSHQELKNLFDR